MKTNSLNSLSSVFTFASLIIAASLGVSLIAGCSDKLKDANPMGDTQKTTQSPDAAQNGSQPGANFTGKILETTNSGGYSYLKLETADKKTVWVAITEANLKVGDSVDFVTSIEMKGFQSKTLKKTFDSILFGQLKTPGAAVDGAPAPAGAKSGAGTAAAPAHMGNANQEPPKPVDAAALKSVKKASGSGAVDVATIYQKKDKLKGTVISINGVVTKVTEGVMGKTWIHLQDASGSEKDLTITSLQTTKIGAKINASGKLAVDQDLGSGYHFPVLLENAALKDL